MEWIIDSLILRIKFEKKKPFERFPFLLMSADDTWVIARPTLYIHIVPYFVIDTRGNPIWSLFLFFHFCHRCSLTEIVLWLSLSVFVFCVCFFFGFVCCRPTSWCFDKQTTQNEYLEAFILQFHWIPTILRVIHANESFLTLDNFNSTSLNVGCCHCCFFFFRISQRKGLCFAKNKIFRHIIRQFSNCVYLCFFLKLLNYIMIWTISFIRSQVFNRRK